MSEDTEQAQPASPEDQTLIRHKRMAEVWSGQRRMGWPDWKDMSIYESKCLTQDGQPVALWAADVLQRALGDDFLLRVEDWLVRMRTTGDTSLAPDAHPILSLGLWPVNDVPWVYANLIWLAAHIHLFNRDRPQNRLGRVLKILRQNLEPINWASALLQLEVAGLGLRAGWDILFEPALGNGRSADVSLTSGSTQLLIETTSMRRSVAERRALAFFDRLSLIADNLRTHTSAGSLLVRSMLTELKEHLQLAYTPAYDPDANRIERLWRISRRVVTHNHHRSTFDLLLADLETHFQTLARSPAEVLRHIGSPFASDKEKEASLPLTHTT